jgi:hypothetical protein
MEAMLLAACFVACAVGSMVMDLPQGKGSPQFFPVHNFDDIMEGRCEHDYADKSCDVVSRKCSEAYTKTLSNLRGNTDTFCSWIPRVLSAA